MNVQGISAGQRLVQNIAVKRRSVLRGRYILRHKGKSLRRHRFNAMFDDVRELTLEQAELRMQQLRDELASDRLVETLRPAPRPFVLPSPVKVKYVHIGNGPDIPVIVSGHRIVFREPRFFIKEPA